MEWSECKNEIRDACLEIQQLQSDVAHEFQRLQLDFTDTHSLQEEELRKLDEMKARIENLKSASGAIVDSFIGIRPDVQTVIDIDSANGVESSFKSVLRDG
ncbi:unnamed protein product [Linum tenue]|uniref:Uncharacterized protein n=1 Tax=Linum tenue TaxID=586396 RepID=A0AAV0RF45_9ROSI|nr:unnamed protein product [Linum tenue]